jgi:hypothetical protein
MRPPEAQTYTTRGEVAAHPPPVAVALLLEAEHLLELVAESKVERLRREVTDDVGVVAAPEGHDTLRADGAAGAVGEAGVGAVQTALLDHLILRGGQRESE